MNGRIYDPLLGRFLSADQVVQFPGNLQSYNRYSYVQNNPLTNRDPSGYVLETAWDVANIGIGAVSLWNNIKEGNVGAAVLDGVGLIADGTAAVLPFVPGGAGTAIKVMRGTAAVAGKLDNASNVIQSGESVVTDVKNGDVGLGTLANAAGAAAGTKGAKADTPNTSRLDSSDVDTKKLDGVDPKTAPSANAGEDGVVYLRRDQDGGEYVGQAKSEQRYEKRQQEHSDANPDSEFEFEELERVSPNSDRTLDVAEEDWIRAGGGPTNKSNPDGGLQNKRHQMSDKRYEENDGSVF